MRIKAVSIAVGTFILLITIWEILAWIEAYNVLLLPPPSKAITAVYALGSEGTLLMDITASAKRYIPGFIIGSIVGVVFGLITGISKNAGYAVNPLFHYFRSIPPVALIPFILVVFGITDAGKVSLVAWASMFPVWLNTQAGVQQVPREYLRAAKIFRASKLKFITDIWLPCSLPYIVSGLRVSVATGLFALAAAEMFAGSSGIGFRIVYSHQLFQTDAMVGMILLLGLVALLADLLLLSVRRRVAKWEAT